MLLFILAARQLEVVVYYAVCGTAQGLMVTQITEAPHSAALVWNFLEVYWPRARGLSAVNAIDTQLRDPINSGLTR